MKVHLVDGTFELFRAFYGVPSMRAPDGREVGATRGLMRSMAALLSEDGVTHVGVAFDTVIESFRNELFDGYKTGAGIDESLWAQFPLAERATRAMGLVTWSMIDFEADDAICTMAARATADARVERVIICSPDKDFGQCVKRDRVVLFDRIRRRMLDEDAIREKTGVPPASIPDWLALVGDTADGIPGVPRWGAKSAAAVLARWEHVDAIPDDPDTWEVKVRGAKTLAESLRGMREEARLYRKLATLRDDVPLEETLDDLEWKGAHRGEIEALCAELGESTVLERIARWRK